MSYSCIELDNWHTVTELYKLSIAHDNNLSAGGVNTPLSATKMLSMSSVVIMGEFVHH